MKVSWLEDELRRCTGDPRRNEIQDDVRTSHQISDSAGQGNRSFKVLRGDDLKTPLCTRLSDIFKELQILLILHRHPIQLSYLRTYYNKTWMKNKHHGIQNFKNQIREAFELSLSADLESN